MTYLGDRAEKKHLRLIRNTPLPGAIPIAGVLPHYDVADPEAVACGVQFERSPRRKIRMPTRSADGYSVVTYLPAANCQRCLVVVDTLLELGWAEAVKIQNVEIAVRVPDWIYPHADWGQTHRSLVEERYGMRLAPAADSPSYAAHSNERILSELFKQIYSHDGHEALGDQYRR